MQGWHSQRAGNGEVGDPIIKVELLDQHVGVTNGGEVLSVGRVSKCLPLLWSLLGQVQLVDAKLSWMSETDAFYLDFQSYSLLDAGKTVMY